MTDSTKYTSKLRNARVLIVGGTSGIGYAVAEACLEQGCSSVIISSSNPARVEKALESLRASYPQTTSTKNRLAGFALDLGSADTLEENAIALLQKATAVVAADYKGSNTAPETEGKSEGAVRLDHIIYTAGDALRPVATSDLSVPAIQRTALVRFIAPQLLAKHLPKYIAPGPRSSFTLTTGSVSEKPRPGWASQNGFATGTHGLARGFALDLAPTRVNAVSPGAVDTPLWDGLTPEMRKGLHESIKKGTCTGVIATPEDVAEAYIYLMRDANVTGSIVSTNGGALLI